jgi:hypothetical protein
MFLEEEEMARSKNAEAFVAFKYQTAQQNEHHN